MKRRLALAATVGTVTGAAFAAAAPANQARTALLVLDAQVGVLRSVWESARVFHNITTLVGNARSAGAPVLWVQHSDEELKFGSPDWQLAPGFAPQPHEIVIHKKFHSAFAQTDLESKLKQLTVGRLVLAGAATSWCVRATAYAAIERGHDLTVVSDAHSTEDVKIRWMRSVPAKDIVDEFNVTMRGIRAPNVRVEVMETKEVKF